MRSRVPERDRIINELTAKTAPLSPLQIRASKRFAKWLKRERLARDLSLHEAAVLCHATASRFFALEESLQLVQSEEVARIAIGFQAPIENVERAAWGVVGDKSR